MAEGWGLRPSEQSFQAMAMACAWMVMREPFGVRPAVCGRTAAAMSREACPGESDERSDDGWWGYHSDPALPCRGMLAW